MIACGNLLITSQTSCICPGDILTYECTVEGDQGGATVLKGNFIDCNNSYELVLHHSKFDEGTTASCYNHTITGQSFSAENNSYTSQFNIEFSSELIGETIECIHDDGISTFIVGNSTIKGTGEIL